MRLIVFHVLFLTLTNISYGLNVTIIESQSNNSSRVMDINWHSVATGMGHTATIVPQTTLDNTAFFATTDILIVSSGTIGLPANRVNTILQFIQSGKSVYLQCEYLSSYTSNQAFSTILGALGATFSWGSTIAGDLNPMNVLGTFATTNNNVSSLSYFWYSVNGLGDCNTVNFLEYGGTYHGFQYVPFNPAYGTIIATTDQDWVKDNTSQPLMENIITHLINNISINPNAVNLGNDTTLCYGQTLLLDATQSGATYLWQDNSSGSTYTVTQAGTYYVAVTNSCTTAYDTIVVNYSGSSSQVSLGNDTTLCPGNTLVLDATTPGGTAYQWQDNSMNPTFTVTQSGTYYVTIDIGCAQIADTITVTYDTGLATIDLGNDTTLCSGNTLALNGNVSGASSYQWQDNSTNTTYIVNAAGVYWVEAANNCSSVRDTIIVSYATDINTVDLGNDTSLCQGSTLVLDVTDVNANGYQWQDNTVNPIYAISAPGTYSVTVSGTCRSSTDQITISYLANPVVDLGNDTLLCSGSTLTLDATQPNATYVWQDNSISPTFTVTQNGTYMVTVSNNCNTSADTISVTYNTAPTLDLGADTVLCFGETLTLVASTPNGSYLWQDGSMDSTYTITQPGNFYVTVNNGCGTFTDTLNASYEAMPMVSLGADTTLCPGDTKLLDVSQPNATYLWQDSSTSANFSIASAGTYSVSVYTTCGTVSDSLQVSYQTITPSVNLGPDTTLCEGEVLTLNATYPNATYSWSDLSMLATLDVSQPGNYRVDVTTQCGTSSDTIAVAFESCDCYVIAPTAFSPNGDGYNDQYGVLYNCPVTNFNMMLFNRWGQKVYETNRIDLRWDGYYQGDPAPIEVYSYLISYHTAEGQYKTLQGTVTLIR